MVPVVAEQLLTMHKQFPAGEAGTEEPLWARKPDGTTTAPPYHVAWTPYTTPTPLPDKPDWNSSQWLHYFKHNHPNFWFKEQAAIKAKAEREKAKLIAFLSKNSRRTEPEDIFVLPKEIFEETLVQIESIKSIKSDEISEIVENVSSIVQEQRESQVEDETAQKSQFFSDPLRPRPEEWEDWEPERWLAWAASPEYTALYLDPTAVVRPEQPDPATLPILPVRSVVCT